MKCQVTKICKYVNLLSVKMPRHLDNNSKIRIITKIEDGFSIRQIAALMNIGKDTVFRIKKRWQQERSVQRKVGSGHPKVSNYNEDAALIEYLRENPFESARMAKDATDFPGSRSTVCRRIKLSDLQNRVAAKKSILTEENKQARVIFALNYIYRDPAFWERVIFTDKKVFKSTNDGHIRVYRPQNSRFNERYVSAGTKSGRFSVNVWAWISYNGMGVCWRIDGRFNAANYLDILENVMMPSVEHLYPNNSFIYQQDNCPVHTTNTVRNWLRNNNVEIIPWVPNSPDMNPIENVWGTITNKLYKRNFHPQNPEQLWQAVQNTWDELADDLNYPRQLIYSVPRRLNEVIARNGSMTHY